MLETALQTAVVAASFVPGLALLLAGVGNLLRRDDTFDRSVRRAIRRSKCPWIRLPQDSGFAPFGYAVRIPAGILLISAPDPQTTNGRLVENDDQLIRFSPQTPYGSGLAHSPRDLNDEARAITSDLWIRAPWVVALVCSGRPARRARSTETGLVSGPKGLRAHIRALVKMAPEPDTAVDTDWEKLLRRADAGSSPRSGGAARHRTVGLVQLALAPALWFLVYFAWQMHAY